MVFQADLVVFKAKRNYVIHLMNEARCTYYKEFIDASSSDQSKLFRASKSLLNLDKSLPPYTDASVLANEMGAPRLKLDLHSTPSNMRSFWND